MLWFYKEVVFYCDQGKKLETHFFLWELVCARWEKKSQPRWVLIYACSGRNSIYKPLS